MNVERRTIAVEEGLSQYKSALEQAGFQTIGMGMSIQSEDWRNADLILISGINENLLGIHDTETKAPVITASGLPPDEVVRLAQNRLS